jgi:hypothetical protein
MESAHLSRLALSVIAEDLPSTTILVGFDGRWKKNLVLVDFYCHEFGKIRIDGRPVRVDVVFSILRPIFYYD